ANKLSLKEYRARKEKREKLTSDIQRLEHEVQQIELLVKELKLKDISELEDADPDYLHWLEKSSVVGERLSLDERKVSFQSSSKNTERWKTIEAAQQGTHQQGSDTYYVD